MLTPLSCGSLLPEQRSMMIVRWYPWCCVHFYGDRCLHVYVGEVYDYQPPFGLPNPSEKEMELLVVHQQLRPDISEAFMNNPVSRWHGEVEWVEPKQDWASSILINYQAKIGIREVDADLFLGHSPKECSICEHTYLHEIT